MTMPTLTRMLDLEDSQPEADSPLPAPLPSFQNTFRIGRSWRDRADGTPSFNIGAVQRLTAESGGKLL